MSDKEEYNKIFNDAVIQGTGFAKYYFKNGKLVCESISIDDVLDHAKFLKENLVDLGGDVSL